MHKLVFAIAALAASLIVVASTAAVTPAQLADAGWTCFVPPLFPDRVVCGNSAQGRPPVPPDPNGRPSYNFFVFDRDGNLRGTEHLIRADLYHGQPCPQSRYALIPPIGYYECQHF